MLNILKDGMVTPLPLQYLGRYHRFSNCFLDHYGISVEGGHLMTFMSQHISAVGMCIDVSCMNSVDLEHRNCFLCTFNNRARFQISKRANRNTKKLAFLDASAVMMQPIYHWENSLMDSGRVTWGTK